MEANIKTEDRRKFLIQSGTLLGIGIFTAVAPSLITSCSNSSSPTDSGSGTYTKGTETVKLSDYPVLQQANGAVEITFSNRSKDYPVLIIHESGNYHVLSTQCPHQGCVVPLPDFSTKKIICNCHGSGYSLDGSLLNGPSPRGLPNIPFTFDSVNQIITINF